MICYVIANQIEPGDTFALGFKIMTRSDAAPIDILHAMKDAAGDYCHTPAGKKALATNGGSFNYGDFADLVPVEICWEHGFAVLETFITEFVAGHNDQLCEPD